MILEYISASPQVFDYLHILDFRPDGYVRMVDGAGHGINGRAGARYHVADVAVDKAIITFTEMSTLDSADQPLHKLDDLRVTVTRETGPFALLEQWGGNPRPSQDDWPCAIFDERFVFDQDPLAFAVAVRSDNLYYQLEPPAFLEQLVQASLVFYPYRKRRQATHKEVVNLKIQIVTI